MILQGLINELGKVGVTKAQLVRSKQLDCNLLHLHLYGPGGSGPAVLEVSLDCWRPNCVGDGNCTCHKEVTEPGELAPAFDIECQLDLFLKEPEAEE